MGVVRSRQVEFEIARLTMPFVPCLQPTLEPLLVYTIQLITLPV
jgi:hypothetical protein